jgi:hypothetical protein
MVRLGSGQVLKRGLRQDYPLVQYRSMHPSIHSVMALLKGSSRTTLEGDKQRPTLG